MKDIILKEANEIYEEMVENRRYLHTIPGVGFDTKETVDFVEKKLIELGYDPIHCGKAGLYADIGNKKGKTILLRSDMDALPMKELTDLPFKSMNDYMHACGHDLHISMLLGAAKLLKKHENEIQGKVRLMFQSAEEILQGARDMIDHGVLEGVDIALMQHVDVPSPLKTGSVVVMDPGASSPTADGFEVIIQGKGCHAGMPSLGIDPIVCASNFILAVQEIQSRELGFFDPGVISFGMIHGGTAPNIIPDTVTLKGTIRTMDEEVRKYIKERFVEIAQGVSTTYRCKVEVKYLNGVTCLVNDATLSKCMSQYAKELLGKDAYLKSEINDQRGTGAEDFSEVSHIVPTIMLNVPAGYIHDGYEYALHHPSVIIDEEVMKTGCALHTYLALRYLKDHINK